MDERGKKFKLIHISGFVDISIGEPILYWVSI